MAAGKFPKRNYEARPRKPQDAQPEQPPARGGERPARDRREAQGGERSRPRGAGRGERAAPGQRAGGPSPAEHGGREAKARAARPAGTLRVRRIDPPAPAAPAAPTAWEGQAQWYDQLLGEKGDDFYSQLILPAVLRQLAARPGQRVLDVCSGQGVLGRALAAQGVTVLGVDASPSLVEAASRRASPAERYVVGDVRHLPDLLREARFDHAAVVMSLQDLDPIAPVLAGIAKVLVPGGRCVLVLSHPCFRIPKRTAWGWDEQWGIQYRRVDAYASPAALPIKTHPGKPDDSAATTSFHRPLATYLNALGAAGLPVTACEELHSTRRGTQGVRSSAEDRAAREIPVFLVLTSQRSAARA